MSKNSENDPSAGKNLVTTWDEKTAQKNPYHYDNTPIREHENVVWYELGGAARAFLLQALARKQNNQNNLSHLQQENKDFIEVSTRQERISKWKPFGNQFSCCT